MNTQIIFDVYKLDTEENSEVVRIHNNPNEKGDKISLDIHGELLPELDIGDQVMLILSDHKPATFDGLDYVAHGEVMKYIQISARCAQLIGTMGGGLQFIFTTASKKLKPFRETFAKFWISLATQIDR